MKILTTFTLMGILLFFHETAIAVDREYKDMLNKLYNHTVKLITVKDLRQVMKKRKIHLLDTRSKEEFQVSHIYRARFAGYENFDINLVKIPKNAIIIVYCSVGYRSEKIGERLLKKGFSNVYNLHGGIFEWINSGFPVYDSKRQTRKIHGYSRKWSRWLKRGYIVH